jgi:hypothetical protein
MAAAKLCCTAPSRSPSPDAAPSRPVRHFKSLANIKTHFANDKHATTTNDRSQPLYPADDMELQRIFVAASLPEDHPHALRVGHRKPQVDESIIHSPTFANKLRTQLSRKSLLTDKPLGKTSSKTTIRPFAYSRKRQTPGLPDLADVYDDDGQSLFLTESRLASLRNDSCVPTDAKSAQHIRFCEPVDRSAIAQDEPRRSISVPPASCPVDTASGPRRSISSSNMQQKFQGALAVDLPGPTLMDANDIWPSSPTQAKRTPAQCWKTATSASPQVPIPRLPSSESSQPQLLRPKSRTSDKQKVSTKDSTNSLHLYDMHISQHLRTRSQVSEASSASEPDGQNRITHASLNSIVLSSMELGRCKSISSSGFVGSAGPPTWEAVLEDGSSSIYSRRPSMALDPPLASPMEHASDFSSEIIQVYPIVSDTSGVVNKAMENTARQAERVVSASIGISFVADGSVSHSDLKDSASIAGSTCSGTWLHHNMTCSLPKSDSSGSLGKLSKFKEDLKDSSTVVKPAKKRRSILRILFPKLTWSILRSAGTPSLGGRLQTSLNQTYDGTGDSQDLLTVPQSSSKPHGGQRAVSFTGEADMRPASAVSAGSLVVPPHLQSRQSLVNYERSLSIAGDNRRRKSMFGESKGHVHGIEDEDDCPERTMHRANPLQSPSNKGTEETLMEKALLQHQAEKAALLRPSNQKLQAAPSSLYVPVFTSSFGFQTTSEARLPTANLEDLDPLEADEPPAARRSQSMHDLRSSQDTAVGSPLFRKKKRSTIWTMNTATTSDTRSHFRAKAPPHSWSRYPSHTRERRCGPAGRRDGIIRRDFAHEQETPSVQQSASWNDIGDSPKSWPRFADARRRNWIVKSRSMTFGAVFRYYSDLLTSSAARNRRSSTATGGRLEHPELEVLPPVLSTYSTTSQQVGTENQLARLVEEGNYHPEGKKLYFLNRSRQESSSGADEPPSTRPPIIGCLHDGTQSVCSQEATESVSEEPAEDKSDLIGSVDGTVEGRPSEPDRALSARRLSRMYQAYVRLPASLDDIEVERSGATDNSSHIPSECITAEPSEVEVNTSTAELLTIPSDKQRLPSGSVTRHFPSVTVIDDRRGHWRSVSLLSADSGKSVRKSTRDLLEVVRATQSQELEKLLGTSEISMPGEKTL